MIICYMAGPIDYEKDKGASWKEELLALCDVNKELAFFDPCAPFKFRNVDADIAAYIHDINMVALERSDILVGSLKKGQTSVGTPIEFYQVRNHKPMIIITDMAESVYMQYIGRQAIFVKDVNELYGKLMKAAHEIEEQRAKMRCQASELEVLKKELTKAQESQGLLGAARA